MRMTDEINKATVIRNILNAMVVVLLYVYSNGSCMDHDMPCHEFLS